MYDGAGQLKQITDGAPTPAEKFGYGYDSAGRVTQLRVAGSGTPVRNYTYDADGELLSELSPGGSTLTHAYDSNLNRLDGGTSSIGADNRVKDDGTWTYQYDGEGNIIHKVSDAASSHYWDYTFDYRNRLTSATEMTSAGTKHVRYLYNAENQRIEQDVDAFHGTGNTLPGSDGTYETQEAYVYDAGEVSLVLKRTDHTLVARYLWGPGANQVLAEDTPAGTHLFVADAEGSVRQVINAADNSVLSTVDYDAFGNTTASGTVTTLPRFAYTGQQADPATGLDYYGARYYDPTAGRFINQDPAQDGSNYYAYVGNNPATLTDPTGMRPFDGGGMNGGYASGKPHLQSA